MRLRLALLVAAAAALAAACGGGGEGEKELPPAEQVLADTVAAIDGVQSFHFALKHENGASPIPLGLELTEAEGDVVSPDRLRTYIRALRGSVIFEADIIGVGEEGWITNPFTRRWEALPKGTTISELFDPDAGVRAIASSLTEVRVSGRESVQGVDAFVLEGTIPSDALEAMAPIAEPGLTVRVRVWTGADDHLIRRIRLEGPFAPGEPENIVRELEISRYNEPVTIEPPS